MFIDGKLSKTNFTEVLNICNLLRAAESLESFLHIPMIASAKKKGSEYSARTAQTIASVLQTQSTM